MDQASLPIYEGYVRVIQGRIVVLTPRWLKL